MSVFCFSGGLPGGAVVSVLWFSGGLPGGDVVSVLWFPGGLPGGAVVSVRCGSQADCQVELLYLCCGS